MTTGAAGRSPRVNDYRSIRLHQDGARDLKQLTRRFHRYFKAEVRYPTRVVKVRVKD